MKPRSEKEAMKFPLADLKIGHLSQLTGVKAGTIRFYEKCGFLEPARRLPNGYRVFDRKHIYQIQVCRLVFGGFVNKRLRKINRPVLQASRAWDLEAYRQAAEQYLQTVREDIQGTKRAVSIVMDKLEKAEDENVFYTKKQAVLQLMKPGEKEDLIYRADRYFETLLQTEEKARQVRFFAGST